MTTSGKLADLPNDKLHSSLLAGVCMVESLLENAESPCSEERAPIERVHQTLVRDIEVLSVSLSEKFEEIRLIHDLAAKLELEEAPELICEDLLRQLSVCVPCETLSIELASDESDSDGDDLSRLIVGSDLPSSEIEAIATAAWRHAARRDGYVHDITIVNESDEQKLLNRRVLVLPIQRGGKHLGRLISIRNRQQPEFGTVEVDLIRSVLMVLSMHLVNQRQYAEMQSMLEGIVRSLASALDAKDAYTHGHSSRVADLAVALSRRLGLGSADSDSLQLAGILHDIGKIGIDDSVLKKPGALTPDEFDQIKRHPVLGYEILKDIRPFRHILPAVRHHHESWDGRGYPDGLSGENIPRQAQILAVADAFDAMVSDRPYRRGMPIEKVCEIFRRGRGQQWAADVVDALLSNEELLMRFADKHQSPADVAE